MSRHVVGPFGVVMVAAALGSDLPEKIQEIAQDIRIGIFLDHQRGGRVADEQRQQPRRHRLNIGPIRDITRNIIEPLTLRLDGYGRLCLFHHPAGRPGVFQEPYGNPPEQARTWPNTAGCDNHRISRIEKNN